MSSERRITAIVLLVTAVLVTGGIALKLAEAQRQHGEPETGVEQGVPVRVAVAITCIPDQSISSWGFLTAFEDLTLSAQVPGYVEKQWVDVSDRVQEGDVLFQIDKSLRETAVDQAKAEVDRARSRLHQAQENYKRVEKLEAAESAVPTEVLQFSTDLEVAAALLRQAEAAATEARLLLEKTTILSPLNGVVARVHTRQGEYANIGQPLLDVMEVDRLRLLILLDDRAVADVAPGDRVSMEVPALSPERFVGAVLRVYPSASPGSRKFEVEIEVPNPDGHLRPGFFVQAAIAPRDGGQGRSIVTIPRMAVFEQFDQQYCYVVARLEHEDQDRAVRRRIETAAVPNDPSQVQVTEGLESGERVVTTGLPHVTHLTLLRVVE